MWRTVQFVLLYVFLRSGETCLGELTGSLGCLHGCFPLTLCKLVPLPMALTPRSVLAACKLSECGGFSQTSWDFPKPRRAVRGANSNTGCRITRLKGQVNARVLQSISLVLV